MQDYCIEETSVWGDAYRAQTAKEVLRCGEKKQMLQTSYPFLDHYKFYAFKPKHQRGPAQESQTFLVSYVYVYDDYIGTREMEFIETLKKISLRFYKEHCMFRGKDAYRILILDTDVHLQRLVELLQTLRMD
jgi:hypothetical protein